MKDADALLERYVAAFEKFDDLTVAGGSIDPIAWQLTFGEPNERGRKHWRPITVQTELSMLDPIYSKLPSRFPALYERLVLSYRWASVDLQAYSLLANPAGIDLSGLLKEISSDTVLWNALLPAGYIPFGRGPGGDYDPVCFDLSSRKQNRDFGIVKIDHEEILCNNRVKVTKKIARSFYQLVLETIDLAKPV